jgi:kynurenine formamidase
VTDCAPGEPATGWGGWAKLPDRDTGRGWTDLTHPFGPQLPYGPKVERMMSLPEHGMNLSRMELMLHCGTHLDAPRHFFADGPSIEEIPLERLWGPGVVWRIETTEHGVIEPADFEAATPELEAGDMVVLDTGFSRVIGQEGYLRHPSLSPAAAQWLVDHGATMVICDFLAPELAASLRPEGYAFPVHHILLGNGVLIVENAAEARPLAGQRVEVVVMPLPIAGSDGSPVRLLARPLTPSGDS